MFVNVRIFTLDCHDVVLIAMVGLVHSLHAKSFAVLLFLIFKPAQHFNLKDSKQ